MLKRTSTILVLGLWLLACNGIDKPKKPDNLISKEQMSELLYDLYVINGAKGVNRKLLETNGFYPETYILEKYNIDSAQFADSNTYYTYDSETYEAIVEKARERLENEREIYEAIKKKEDDSISKRKDSIKALKKTEKQKLIKRLDSVGSTKLAPNGPSGIVDSLLL